MKLAKKSLCVALYALAIASTPALADLPIKERPAMEEKASFEADRADILAMAGNFKVRFDMQESTRWDARYTPLDRKICGFVKLFENASDIVKLTATMCIEHFTAIVAAEILRDKKHLDGTDGELRELWLWHAVEEVEHKGVAFDVWKYASRDWNPVRAWVWRSSFMALITLSFFINRT